ncbi:hypothetical protein [Citrobacter sp. TSA-1]|uniref:hypothetical protein n=1 Tax=Citrobacter sp. TSA-1 TaxID=184912 RepID=UPI000BADDB6E|nr:hypothetical protein [Citrobacter sp. TSA-1]PAX78136.1 hypothetical protein CIK43_19080 [Citrobacter sp. TSA-1]QKE19511.1 hypothetical protein HF677_007440 [Citrobacter sp. TSA-1]
MALIGRSDLYYKDYNWEAITGDDPTKTAADRNRFSRQEGYEVLSMLNSLSTFSIREKLIAEWMIHEHLPSSIQGREQVRKWIIVNFTELKPDYPR